MSSTTAKQKVLEAMERLPAEATVEDAIERLVLLAKIEQGLHNSMRDKGSSIARLASAPPVTPVSGHRWPARMSSIRTYVAA